MESTEYHYHRNPQNEDDMDGNVKVFLVRLCIGVGIGIIFIALFKISSYFTRKYFARKAEIMQTSAPQPCQGWNTNSSYVISSDNPPIYNDAMKVMNDKKGLQSQIPDVDEVPPPSYDYVLNVNGIRQ